MNFVKIENGVVTNRATFANTLPPNWPNPSTWVQDNAAQIGWLYDGVVFTPPTPPTPPPPTTEQQRNTAFIQSADYQDLLNNINSATPAQIKTFVTSNVNNLADAKVLMAKILLLLALIARGA